MHVFKLCSQYLLKYETKRERKKKEIKFVFISLPSSSLANLLKPLKKRKTVQEKNLSTYLTEILTTYHNTTLSVFSIRLMCHVPLTLKLGWITLYNYNHKQTTKKQTTTKKRTAEAQLTCTTYPTMHLKLSGGRLPSINRSPDRPLGSLRPASTSNNLKRDREAIVIVT